jgi:hypothetical protein
MHHDRGDPLPLDAEGTRSPQAEVDGAVGPRSRPAIIDDHNDAAAVFWIDDPDKSAERERP